MREQDKAEPSLIAMTSAPDRSATTIMCGTERWRLSNSGPSLETLLVHDDPQDDRTAVFERSGFKCATDAAAIDAGGEGAVIEGRLVDVAIRSALLGDSEIRMVPSNVVSEDGLGALQRW